MDQLQRHYLEVMGIDVWERRAVAPDVAQVQESTARTEVAGSDTGDAGPAADAPQPLPENVDWPELEQAVAACTRCDELVANRTRTVFGVGKRNADWLIIGEAPGADEDRQGEPFVGRAGQLLNAMLRGIGLAREQVYIANILKCRPPNNRDPKPEEAAACSVYLQQQIALIQPKVILAVGRIAAQNLLQSDAPIGALRGQVHRLENGLPLIVTYHPAYLLRSPLNKHKSWSDLCLARRVMRETMEAAP